MKKILITQRIAAAEYGEIRDAIDIRWGLFLQSAGLLPLPFISSLDPDRFLSAAAPDGILFTGGNDLSAINDAACNRARDAVEWELMRCAVARRIPLLGVCRGMQVIAAFFGASVVPVEGHAGVRHKIASVPGRRYSALLREASEVNSFHRYGVRQLTEPLLPLAMSEDGVTEALMHRDLPMLGIMFHPERNEPFDARDLRLVQGFFAV